MKLYKYTLRNLGIKRSIFGLFTILSALHFLFGLFSFEPLNKLSRDATDLKSNNLQADIRISKLERYFWNIRLTRARYTYSTPEEREILREEIFEWNKAIDIEFEDYRPLADSPTEKKETGIWQVTYEQFSKSCLHFFYLVDIGKLKLAKEYERQQILPLSEKAIKALENLDDYQNLEAIEKENKVIANVKRSRTILSLIALLSGIVASVVTYLSVNWISNNHQQKLEALGKMSALGDITRGIAHEVSSPLTVLNMISEQIEENLSSKEIDVSLFKHLNQKIRTSTARIATTIASLKAFSKSKNHDPFVSFNVKFALDQAMSLCKSKIGRFSVSVHVDLIPEDLKITGQPAELSHVIFNLLDNALDAVSKLDQRWIKILVIDLGEIIEVSVIDSGPGIPKPLREKLFKEPITTKTGSISMGLGLSICGRIVAAHDGNIFVDKNYKNTRFIVQLPKKSPRIHGKAA